MKKILYQKPAMKVVQLQQRTQLLQSSMRGADSNAGLNYRGSDADYDDDAR